MTNVDEGAVKGKAKVLPDLKAAKNGGKKAKGDTGKEPKAAKASTAVAMLKQSALSTDVGVKVLETLDKTAKDEAKFREGLAGVEARRFEALSITTNAIVKAASADEAIDLNAAFSTDRARQNKLNAQIYIALGVKELMTFKGGKTTVVTSKAAAKFFSTGKEDKNSPAYKAKKTMATNFAHLVKKCAQAAAGLIDMSAVVKTDKEAGTLLISGPKVKAAFGVDEVTLNEKRVDGMKEGLKPSYTEVARIAATNRDVVHTTRKDSRSAAITADKAIIAQCESLVASLGKFKGDVTDDMKAALVKVGDAIDNYIS